jgi:hypothetical protein
MIKKRVERRDGFSVDIYRKKDDKCELVFRKNSTMLHRLGAIEGCERLTKQFKAAVSGGGKADVIELRSTRGRRWVAEIVSTEVKAVVLVWELKANGTSVLRFIWEGSAGELQIAFN